MSTNNNNKSSWGNFDPNPRWYIVHTYSGYENKVKSNLEKAVENRHFSDRILEIVVPVEKVAEKKIIKVKKIDEYGLEQEVEEEKITETENKPYPCYVFVKMIMSEETWHVVRNITGSTGFVGPGSRPVPLSDDEVEKLGVEKYTVSTVFKVGDKVNIIGGFLSGFSGKIDSISEDGKTLTVLADMYGRETAVQLDASSAQLITD